MMQTLLAIFIPTFAVLVGILLNRNDYSKLDARLSAMENRLDSRLGAVESRLDARMNGLEGRFHADIVMVISKLTELEARVAKLEAQRQ